MPAGRRTTASGTRRLVVGGALLACLAACAFPGQDAGGRVSPPGRPEGEFRSAQREGSPVSLPDTLTGGVIPGERVKRLLHVADAEWRRWGAQVVRIPDGDCACAIVVSGECEPIADGCGQEQNVALCPVVNEFWAHIRLLSGESFSHDCSQTGVCEHTLPAGRLVLKTPGWSAAFLSAVMHRAGFAAAEFLPSPYHANYVVAARDGLTTAYTVVPTPAYVEPGDIICTTRFAAIAQYTPDEIALLTPNDGSTGATPMHCDLVVAVDLTQRRAGAIGGNVMQSVSMSDIALDAQGRLSPRVNAQRSWLLVMKLRPELRAAN